MDGTNYSASARQTQALNALDRPLTVTRFPTRAARRKSEHTITLRALAPRILKRTAPTKDDLPWLKLARFGEKRTTHNCLRHNANLLSIDGIEGDYDGGTMRMEIAAARLRAARIAGLLYTSGSHTEEKPRFRVLCPTSVALPPDRRAAFVARLNGVLGGTLDPSSFTLSQAFYYGSVNKNPAHRVDLVEGRYSDLAYELDAGAIGKGTAPAAPSPIRAVADDDPLSGDRPDPQWPKIESALAAIPVEKREDRKLWLDIGMALHNECGAGEEGFSVWDEWSEGASNYGGTKEAWESFGQHGAKPLSIGTLFYRAGKHGWAWNNAPEPEETPAADAALSDFLNTGHWLARELEPPEPLLGEIITNTTRMFVGGPTGLGKTHLGMAMAAGMASGQGFLHWEAARPSRVLYIDGEMARDLVQERLADLQRRMGDADLSGLFVLCTEDYEELAARFPTMGAFAPLNTEDGRQFILNLVAMLGGVDAVFFDNRMSLTPGDMKDEEPWMQTMPLVKELTRQRIAQVWLDHTGNATDRLYGTKTKEWQFDSVALLSKVQRPGVDIAFAMEFTKARRRKPSNRADFEKTIFAMMGDKWTAETGVAALESAVAMTPSEAAALAVLEELTGPETDGRTSEQQWRQECTSRRSLSGSDKPNTQWRAMDRAVSGLVRKGLVEVRDGLAWAPGGAIEADFEDDE
jgi:hypothetical protein